MKETVTITKKEYDELVESRKQLGCYIEDQKILLQGNIPQGYIVIAKKQYNHLTNIQKNYDPFWFCTYGGCEGISKNCKDDCSCSIFTKTREEVLKDFLVTNGWTQEESESIMHNYMNKKYGIIYKVDSECSVCGKHLTNGKNICACCEDKLRSAIQNS